MTSRLVTADPAGRSTGRCPYDEPMGERSHATVATTGPIVPDPLVVGRIPGDGEGEITSDRRYHFDASVQDVWAAIGNLGHYRVWWPWLRSFSADELAVGQEWRCEIRPPVPYRLRLRIALAEVEQPSWLSATVSGDVRGVACVALSSLDDGCAVRVVSCLSPGSSSLRRVSRYMRPLAQFGHDWVLDTGAAQFGARAI